jgi:type I restriction enzyme, S subunit
MEVPVGEVADINPTFKSVTFSPDELVDFLPMAAVEEGNSVALATEYRPLSDVQKGYTNFSDGDVLLAKITPCFENGKIARVRLRHRCGFGSTEFHVLRPHDDKLDGRYLVHFLRRDEIRIDGARKMTGSAGQRRVPKHYLESLRIYLPPLPEQRRIAAILDQADTLRAKRREALAQLDSLTQSIFIEMFGNAQCYPEITLDELCELITDGTHQTPTYADEGVTFLSARNVTSGKIDWSDVKFIPKWLHEELHKRLAPRRNDILLAKNGTTGIAAIVDRDDVFDIYVSLALLRPKQGVLTSYLNAAINSPICKKQFNGALKGIGVPNLHLKEIRSTRVPSPPLKAQQEFGTRITALESLKRDNVSALEELDALFASLQHRAFRGDL